jgi:hypothetical protein
MGDGVAIPFVGVVLVVLDNVLLGVADGFGVGVGVGVEPISPTQTYVLGHNLAQVSWT